MSTCALRPDGIWGPGGSLMLDSLAELLAAGTMVARVGGMGGLHDHVYIDNLVHAHLLVADVLVPGSPVLRQGLLYFGWGAGPHVRLVRPLFEGLGYQVPERNIPAAPLRVVATLWQWLHFKLGIPEPLLTPHELNKLTISTIAHSNAAKRDFGYAPVKSVAEGMAASIAYYRAQAGE